MGATAGVIASAILNVVEENDLTKLRAVSNFGARLQKTPLFGVFNTSFTPGWLGDRDIGNVPKQIALGIYQAVFYGTPIVIKQDQP